MPMFTDRRQAGRILARRLFAYQGREDVVVLGLPRGGVPVAAEVARELRVPLDVFVVRKLGVPGNEELAMGAVGPAGVMVVDWETVESFQVRADELDAVVKREQAELARRERVYRGNAPPRPLDSRVAILVDDGLATGASMRAAIRAIRAQNPARVVVGVPIAAPSTCQELSLEVDEIVCAITPEPFLSVGLWYRNFRQTTDEEVRQLLSQASGAPASPAATAGA
jgi:putative phosphoribosyl transferase